ncbi:MAG: hypothetical protein GY716_23385 [bacterium]|nr:hypothetical protein [bacterium]
MSRQQGGFEMLLFRVVCIVGLFTSITLGGDEIRELQKIAAGDVRMIADSVRSYAVVQNKYPGDLAQFTDAAVLEQQLVPDHARALPPLDPWGRPYWYWTNGEHFIVGSGGARGMDQKWRTELSTDPRGPAVVLQDLCSSPGRSAVLFVDGRFCALPKDVTEAPIAGELTEQERQALTARDVRTIAIAVMSYSIDNNTYPVLTGSTSGVQALQPLLEPHYVRGLPISDGWEHGYFYWSDGKNFIVYSTGGDHEDQPYYNVLRDTDDAAAQIASICSGASRRLGADIVFANGEPCQWPEGSLDD